MGAISHQRREDCVEMHKFLWRDTNNPTVEGRKKIGSEASSADAFGGDGLPRNRQERIQVRGHLLVSDNAWFSDELTDD
jgi:hypothetical protein